MNPNQAMKSQATDEFLYSLFVQLAQDVRLHWRDLETLNRRCSSEGVSFLTQTLPALSKAMIKGLATGRLQLPSSFKRRSARSALPAFMGSHFAKVFHNCGALRSDACPETIRQIRQFLEFAYKADLPRKAQKDLDVVKGFVATEDELSRLEIESDPLLLLANAIASELFNDFDRNDLQCKHGPGVTANVNLSQKFEHRLTPGLRSVTSFDWKYFFFSIHGAWEPTYLDRYPVWSHKDYFSSNNCAKVILVPKDSRGPRLISCEPAENQYIQQGIARYMVDKLESHPISAGHVNFTDQSINRRLAQENSISREYSTLDLKDASDRVSMVLVEKVFRGLNLLEALRDVRSEYTRLPSRKSKSWRNLPRKVKLAKHAPMGSALCFPVMASTIYLLIIAGMIGLGLSLPEAIASVYVYGDDVIVKTEYAHFAIGVLERYGLKVNHDKSFIDSRFLESCGLDAFDGVNVTPTRLRKCDLSFDKSILEENPAVLVSLTETANLMAESGYRRTSEKLYNYSEGWLGPLPYGHRFTPYLSRWVPPIQEEYLPEMNYLKPGIRWFPRRNRQRYPLGVVMSAWAVKPIVTNAVASVYGHLQRIWGMLGKEELEIPLPGAFTLPRQYVLVPKVFDHYAMRDASYFGA